MEEIEKRNPVLAFTLSILTLGLGQIYNGQLSKGLFIFAGTIILSFLNLIIVGLEWYGIYIGLTITLVYTTIVIIDSVKNAVKQKRYTLKKYNKWYVYLLILLMGLFNGEMVLSLNPYESYTVMGNSMLPNFKDGDRLLIDKSYYLNDSPTRGDVILFEHPSYLGQLFFKRVVALEGETLKIDASGIYINGSRIKKDWLFYGEENGDLKLYGEGKWLVPDNSVFVLGDNLNHSFDSRDMGAVSLEGIKGKVLYIYWPKNKKIGQKLRP